MSQIKKALIVAKIKDNDKAKRGSLDTHKRGPWDRGKVKKAEGGDVDKPAFDPSKPFEASDQKPAFDPSKPFDAAPATPDNGTLHAIGHGAFSGVTAGFSDELSGLNAAGPSWVDKVPLVGAAARPVAGAAKLGYEYLTGSDVGATKQYEEARDAERAAQKSAQEHHPLAYGASEAAGAIAPMLAAPEVMGPIEGAGTLTNLSRLVGSGAAAGAGYGGLSGLGQGTDASSRLEGAGTGAIGGGAGGALGAAAGSALGAAANRFAKPIVQTVRGWIDPEAEAGRRVATALRADQKMIDAGTAKGMSPQDWIAARQAGEPVTLADLGAGNTQSLLRSAANTSPEGRALLEKVIEDRFLNQSERVAGDVRNLVAGGANAGKTADELVEAYNKGRGPLYKRSYTEGDKEIISPEMERLMGAPVFEQAMKNAVTSGKDRAISEGYGAFNPGVTVENGLIKFSKTKPNGVPQYPNLQYWDAVKKELDGMASVAQRQGDTTSVAGKLAKTLRDELDKQVPSYADARGFAANFFGEKDALQAGRTLAGKNADPQVIKQAIGKMKPDEQNLFREGYASDWADRVISNIRDTRDITKAMFNSPNERARAEAVFGPAGMAKIQARMTLETIMDRARQAMGGSTTARQLIEAGLAGGALSGYASGWDPVKALEGAGAAATARFGAGKFLASEVSAGAKKLVGKVDATTARNVARLLTSNNPGDLAQGLRMATKNEKISEGLRRIANTLSLSGSAPSGANTGRLMINVPQGPMAAGAQDEKPKP
jgi:hypothetical protein